MSDGWAPRTKQSIQWAGLNASSLVITYERKKTGTYLGTHHHRQIQETSDRRICYLTSWPQLVCVGEHVLQPVCLLGVPRDWRKYLTWLCLRMDGSLALYTNRCNVEGVSFTSHMRTAPSVDTSSAYDSSNAMLAERVMFDEGSDSTP